MYAHSDRAEFNNKHLKNLLENLSHENKTANKTTVLMGVILILSS